MAGDGWISLAIMALAAVVAGLFNILALIATSNTNIMYMENMLGPFIHFDDVPPPILTADEKILQELYLHSLFEGSASSGGFPPAGVHHPPPVSDTSAGGFSLLAVIYYFALAVLILYPLVFPFVCGRIRKRANAGSAETVRTLREENDYLRATLHSKEDQTRTTEIKLNEVEKSKSDLKTELAKMKTTLVRADTLDYKSEEDLNNEVADLKKELQEAKTRLQNVENSKITAKELLSSENTDLMAKLELATTKWQLAEESMSELRKDLTQAKAGLKGLESLTEENTNLKTKLERTTTQLQGAEKSKTELENNLAQAKTDLKDLDPLTKENTDLKARLEESTGALQLAEKSKSELKKDLDQTNDGLGEQLRKAKATLKGTEESKVTELGLRAMENEKAVNFWAKEKNDLKNELQKARTTLQEAELSKSTSEASLNKVITDLTTELQKARAMLKEEEESKPRAVDNMVQKNADLRDPFRGSEALTPAESVHTTYNISPQTFPENIQSAPPTPNNRVDMPPTEGNVTPLDTNASLPMAANPIASPDPLGLSMSKSSFAFRFNSSKEPFIRNSTGSSVDPKNIEEKEVRKEESRRSIEDIRPKLTAASSTGRPSNADGVTLPRTGVKPPYSDDYRTPTGRIGKRNRGNINYKQDRRQRDTATPSQPGRQDIRSWHKDAERSSVLNKDGPGKGSPNSSGEAPANALNNPTIQKSLFTPVPVPPEHMLTDEHIRFIQTLKKQGLGNKEITAKTLETFPLLYEGKGVMGARPNETSRERLVDTQVGLYTMSYAPKLV